MHSLVWLFTTQLNLKTCNYTSGVLETEKKSYKKKCYTERQIENCR